MADKHVSSNDLGIAGFLASLSICYSGLTYRWERARRALVYEAQPAFCPNLLASWGFAAALLLPLPLACAVIAVAGLAEWPARKIIGAAKLHRYIYSTAGAFLAAAAVRGCLDLPIPRLAALLLAMASYTFAGAAIVAAAMLSVGDRSAIRWFCTPRTYYLEFVTMTIAVGEMALLRSTLPTLAWLSLPATIALQRIAVKADLRAAEHPPAIRPMNTEAWLLIAREVIAACPVGAVMRVDTADPAAVNYLARVQAGCDAIGMVGDSGLAVLLTECPGPNAAALAVRLRSVLHRQGIPAQVAVAAKPGDGQSLDDLLAVSEAELIARVAATRVARSDRPEA